ncbi:uncharacterized protein LOC113798501 [Dermatophagoides pteronyssinus]|uniref:uncharacterized protein LOC113798501 n=1 Tax=Dermatophagoides pteronyssinus TaxID=6956 RepID=UPI003F668CA7
MFHRICGKKFYNVFNRNLIRYCSTSSIKSLDIPPEFIKTITYRTCVGLYDRLRKEQPKVFRNSPSEGLDITIDYVDNWQPNHHYDKVIVAIHGTSDTYRTFTKLINHFHQQKNVRVIVPNQPDYRHTRQTNFQFWHTFDEKYYCIKDFLEQLKIKQIDCLIGHSLGAHACLMLHEQRPHSIQIRSLGLHSPAFALEAFDPKIIRGGKFLLNISKSQLMTRLLKAMNFQIPPYKFDNIDDIFLMVSFVQNFPDNIINDSIRRLMDLKQRQTPGFITYGTDERLISKYAIDKLHEILQISNRISIDQDDTKSISSLPTSSSIIKSYLLKDAGHFPHVRYPNISHYLIEQLLQL